MEWNNSALSCLEQCAERFRRRYIEKDSTPPGLNMRRGTIVHRLAAEAHKRQIAAKEAGAEHPLLAVPGYEEVFDLAATQFDADLRAGGATVTEDEITEAGGLSLAIGAAKDAAVEMAGHYVGRVAPNIDPIAVERKIVVRPKDSDLVIHGTMDLIASHPLGEEIRDQKTSLRSPASTAADRSQQLTMYAMLRGLETGTLPRGVVLDYIVRTPVLHRTKHVMVTSTRDEADVQTLVERLNTAVAAVKRGVFVPTRPEDPLCSPRYCEFWSSCKYVSRA